MKKEGSGLGARLFERHLIYQMTHIVLQANRGLSGGLRTKRLRLQEWNILHVLDTVGTSTVNDLARDLVAPQSTVSRILMRMEKNGLISRLSVGPDNRVVTAQMAPKGRQLFRDTERFAVLEYERLFRGLTEKDIATFAGALLKMIDNVTPAAEEDRRLLSKLRQRRPAPRKRRLPSVA